MRRPPPFIHFTKYPVVSGTIALAVVVTLAWWSGRVNIDPLRETIGIRQGQLWRILSSTLPHINILHLVFNIYWIWVFGTLVESVFGDVKTLGIFVVLALASNGAEYAVLDGGVGLSGIGYGLFGMIWVLSARDRRFATAIDTRTVGLFVAWFFFCIILTVSGTPIANVAHGVGAIAGALLGFAISMPSPKRIAATGAFIFLLLVTLVCDTIARPWVNFSKERGADEAYLGYEALMAHKDNDALIWYQDAVVMQPQDPSYWFNLGIAYQRLEKMTPARAAYRRAHELAPEDAKYNVPG